MTQKFVSIEKQVQFISFLEKIEKNKLKIKQNFTLTKSCVMKETSKSQNYQNSNLDNLI